MAALKRAKRVMMPTTPPTTAAPRLAQSKPTTPARALHRYVNQPLAYLNVKEKRAVLMVAAVSAEHAKIRRCAKPVNVSSASLNAVA